MKTLTVKEVIAELEKMPLDAEVIRGDMQPVVEVAWANDEWAENYRGKVVIS